VTRRRQRQHRRHLDGEPRLAVRPPELTRARLVHHQEQRDFALLVECLDEGTAHAGGDVPVDGTEVVALLVGAHLCELDALPAEDRPVFAREQGVDQGASAQLDPFDLP